jgi:chemotaxis protein methyltransferase CheR
MAPEAVNSEVIALARYVAEVSGIELDGTKEYLFESRCRGLMLELKCANLGGLLRQVVTDRTGKLRDALIDAISTQETSFFREPQQFVMLSSKLVAEHFESQGSTRLALWSAAASTGQEAFSIAITLRELFGPTSKYQLRIIGTDISGAALAKASRGSYTKLEIERGLSPARREKHFTQQGDRWQVRDELRSMCTFQRLNLMESCTHLGQFDIIFCRNVAIYFSPENRDNLFWRLAQQLRIGGYLVVSLTEQVPAKVPGLVREEFRGITYYRRVQATRAVPS